MSSTKIINVTTLLGLLVLQLNSPSAHTNSGTEQKKIKVVATTSLIGSIVDRIGRENVEVITVIPAGMCPGHFDITPGDAKTLKGAELFLKHGFEGEKSIKNIENLLGNPAPTSITLNVEGNWMVPNNHILAVDKITGILCESEPKKIEAFKSEADRYKKEIKELETGIRAEAEKLNVDKIKVICSDMQTQFVEWIGFEVVATFGRPDSISPRQLQEIVDKGRTENVKIVIDNLQSGGDAGLPIASEIKATHIILTNFPIEYGGEFSYLKSLEENADKLLKGLRG